MRLRPLQSTGPCTVICRKLKVRSRPLQSRESHTVTLRKLKVKLRPIQDRGSHTITCWKSKKRGWDHYKVEGHTPSHAGKVKKGGWDHYKVEGHISSHWKVKIETLIHRGSCLKKIWREFGPILRKGSLFEKDLKLGKQSPNRWRNGFWMIHALWWMLECMHKFYFSMRMHETLLFRWKCIYKCMKLYLSWVFFCLILTFRKKCLTATRVQKTRSFIFPTFCLIF